MVQNSVVKLAQHSYPAELIIVADPDLLQQRAALLNLPLTIRLYDPKNTQPQQAQTLTVLPVSLKVPSIPGQLNTANAEYVINTLERATTGCL